jgi:hypothetical protein
MFIVASTKVRAKLRRSDMLKLLSHIRLESEVIQQRETPRRHDTKVHRAPTN